MSVFAGPEITNDGLILCLDAINSKSFNNTTYWNDISGLNNHAVMYGTVPVSSDGGACFDFSTVTGANASSASLGFTFSSNMIPTTGSFTLSTWIKNPPTVVGQCGMFSNSGSGDGYRFGVGLNGIYWLIGPTYSEGGINFISPISASTWNNVTCVFDRSGVFHSGAPYIDLYLNGVYQNQTTINATQTAFISAVPGLVRSACCALYTGKIARFSAYNKALSAVEIKQDFNAHRGRFGI